MVGEKQTASAGAVQAELRRILASPAFDASERNRHFLAYVVEEALAGRSERIKAYTIATAVFRRDEGFDPQLDSIPYQGRPAQALARALLSDRRPGEPPPDRHPARSVRASVPPHRSGAGPAGSGRLAESAGEGPGSFATNPSQPGSYRIGLFLCHFAHAAGSPRSPPRRPSSGSMTRRRKPSTRSARSTADDGAHVVDDLADRDGRRRKSSPLVVAGAREAPASRWLSRPRQGGTSEDLHERPGIQKEALAARARSDPRPRRWPLSR